MIVFLARDVRLDRSVTGWIPPGGFMGTAPPASNKKNELLVFFLNNPRSKSLALEAKVKTLHLQEHMSYLIEIVTCGGNSKSIS